MKTTYIVFPGEGPGDVRAQLLAIEKDDKNNGDKEVIIMDRESELTHFIEEHVEVMPPSGFSADPMKEYIVLLDGVTNQESLYYFGQLSRYFGATSQMFLFARMFNGTLERLAVPLMRHIFDLVDID